MTEYKNCLYCKKLLHFSKYHKNASMPDGVAAICKSCKHLWDKKNRKKKTAKQIFRNFFYENYV